jgi:Ni/Co efflux regulator RcnB
MVDVSKTYLLGVLIESEYSDLDKQTQIASKADITKGHILQESYRGNHCLEILEYDRRDLSRWPRGNLYPQKLALTSPTSGGRSLGRYS